VEPYNQLLKIRFPVYPRSLGRDGGPEPTRFPCLLTRYERRKVYFTAPHFIFKHGQIIWKLFPRLSDHNRHLHSEFRKEIDFIIVYRYETIRITWSVSSNSFGRESIMLRIQRKTSLVAFRMSVTRGAYSSIRSSIKTDDHVLPNCPRRCSLAG